jgi:hypothetical protein
MAERVPFRMHDFEQERERLRRAIETVDSGGGPPHDGGMEARVAKLEADLTAIKIDVAVIKANGSTKSDVAELRELIKSSATDFKAEVEKVSLKTGKDLAESQTKMIFWIVGTIVIAQILPALLKLIPH